MAEKKYVAYYRVSTKRQGQSGLGLEAQRQAVEEFLKGNGAKIIAGFTEAESASYNRRSKRKRKAKCRPELQKAISTCRVHGAILVIAKLDRLARNVAFTATLMESDIEFVAVDFPMANRLTIHVLAAVAEHESEAISNRTRAALAVAKQRGKRLGNPHNFSDEGRRKGAKMALAAKIEYADEFAQDLKPTIEAIRAEGVTSLAGIARELNSHGIPTARGKRWQAVTVKRVLERMS